MQVETPKWFERCKKRPKRRVVARLLSKMDTFIDNADDWLIARNKAKLIDNSNIVEYHDEWDTPKGIGELFQPVLDVRTEYFNFAPQYQMVGKVKDTFQRIELNSKSRALSSIFNKSYEYSDLIDWRLRIIYVCTSINVDERKIFSLYEDEFNGIDVEKLEPVSSWFKSIQRPQMYVTSNRIEGEYPRFIIMPERASVFSNSTVPITKHFQSSESLDDYVRSCFNALISDFKNNITSTSTQTNILRKCIELDSR